MILLVLSSSLRPSEPAQHTRTQSISLDFPHARVAAVTTGPHMSAEQERTTSRELAATHGLGICPAVRQVPQLNRLDSCSAIATAAITDVLIDMWHQSTGVATVLKRWSLYFRGGP